MIPTTLNNTSISVTQTVASATIGIASLILEGRALSEDDFVIQANSKKHVLYMPPGYNSATMQQNHAPLINITTNPTAELPLPPKLAATLSTAAALAAATTAVVASNSQKTSQQFNPSLPSTSKSSISTAPSAALITENLLKTQQQTSLSTAAATSSSSGSSSLASSFQSTSSVNGTNFNTTDPSVQHYQRIREKLSQLRHSSPQSSSDPFMDHKIAVGGPSNLHHRTRAGTPDVTIDNVSSGDECDSSDFSQGSSRNLHRKLSSGNSPVWGQSSGNFERKECGGSASLLAESRSSVIAGSTSCNSSCNNSGGVSGGSGGGVKSINNHLPDNNLLQTLQSLATNCLWTSPRSLVKTTEDWDHKATGIGTTNANGSTATVSSNNHHLNTINMNHNFNSTNMNINIANTNNTRSCTQTRKEDKTSAYPKQGPHCDHFLKKIGLNGKKEQQITEIEEHICDMANLNEICFHWQVHCRQIEVMLSRADPICIEVFLGPENDEILMEQWIIEKLDCPTIPSMTIQALCNAIRSQLYFSQITAWSDLIKKASPFDNEIIENGRIKSFHTIIGGRGVSQSSTSSSGMFLATGCTQSGSATSSNLTTTIKKPRLDIFYRIRPYDSTASFNAKPNIHNFPNVLISGNCAISVCLKSLPRLQGGIPKINNDLSKNLAMKPTMVNLSTNPNNISGQQLHPQNVCNNSRADGDMLLDDSLNIPCTEKGKHKCNFDEEDGGSSDTVGESSGNSSSGGSAENCDSVHLTHREKQLMKYRKRMMKRDKNKKKTSNASNASVSDQLKNTYNSSLNQQSSTINIHNFNAKKIDQKRKVLKESILIGNQDENKFMGTTNLIDGKAQIEEIHMLQKQPELGSINSIGLPLYHTITNSTAESVQTQPIEMVSIGTQTADLFLMTPCCDKCGSEMTAICFNCNKMEYSKKPLLEVNTDYSNYHEKSNKSPDRKLGKGELLLQAIQRVPKNKSHDNQNNNFSFNLLHPNSLLRKATCLTSSTTNDIMKKTSFFSQNDCQLCKRQKTQHIYKQKDNLSNQNNKTETPSNNNNSNFLKKCCNQTIEINNQQMQQRSQSSASKLGSENINCNCSPTCLTVRMDDYEIENGEIATQDTLLTPPLSIDTNNLSLSNNSINSSMYKSNVGYNCNETIASPQLFDTPKSQYEEQKLSKQIESKSLLKITCDTNEEGIKTSTATTKILPKINLTNVFCNNNNDSNLVSTVSSPIPIIQQNGFLNSPDSIKSDISLNSVISTPEIPVQKSNSAPTLPNSPSLSPRFLKQAAAYKRRSRHLSDRSDRSSLGSDDLSDEDLDSLYPSPSTSPLKSKFFTKLSAFARRPLLGNLEESLFQKRFVPKMNVSGFKVLLGASGQFCPTQLTIPAASYFYELDGEILSTPYVCEVRLPRKGYTIPRFGTVQATLLNPFGTVVRMFVIPYDFRDMPPMNQTFIRQRILAVDHLSDDLTLSSSSINNSSNNHKNDNNLKNNNDNNNMNNKKINLNKIILNNSYNNNNENNINNVDNSVPHCSKEHLSSLRYSIHLRFQTSRSGRLALHTDIRFLISRRTDCDTAAAHAKGALESPNELRIVTVIPDKPKYSARQEPQNSNKM